MTILMVSMLWIAYLLGVLLFVGRPPAGFTSILVSLWLLGGLIIFSIGVVVDLMLLIFTKTEARPVHDRPGDPRA